MSAGSLTQLRRLALSHGIRLMRGPGSVRDVTDLPWPTIRRYGRSLPVSTQSC
jgi:hypothetical protein